MQNLEALAGRVSKAGESLNETERARAAANRDLAALLARLEDRFKAQEKELAYQRARLIPLEEANRELEAMLADLLGVVEQTAEAEQPDSVRAAKALAEELDGHDIADTTPLHTIGSTDLWFEDVSPEDLVAEDAADQARFGPGFENVFPLNVAASPDQAPDQAVDGRIEGGIRALLTRVEQLAIECEPESSGPGGMDMDQDARRIAGAHI